MVLAHDVNERQRTRDIEISADVTFDTMLLSNATLCGLKNSGFHKPSPIQLLGIPLGKCGFDLFLEAKSGTGKTAVFTVIALESLHLDKGLQVIILAPTREIAAQISDVIKQIGSSCKGLNVEVVMGGLPVEEDICKLKKNVHILVGSPGRMRHLIQDRHVQISGVRMFVLDEADKLIDKSFQADINYIFSSLPQQKQVIMSSATYPDALKNVMENYVKKAQHICPDSNSILLGIKQLVTVVQSNINIVRQTHHKFEELLKILSKQEFKQCLVFCNYQGRVVELCKMLIREKWPAEQLHGLLEQNDRLDALKTLQSYKCRILVSTDIASRGIDACNVDLVINFEPPATWTTYLHRIGRAGRFGTYGIAISILSKGEVKNFKEMIKDLNVPINLHCLWNDNTFELCDQDINNGTSVNEIKATEILETSAVREMCKTVDTVEVDDQDIDTCDNLLDISLLKKEKHFDSLQKPKECKIESFNDLMTSFKDFDPNNNEKLKIKDINTEKKCFDSMNQENQPTENRTEKYKTKSNDLSFTSLNGKTQVSIENLIKQNGCILKDDTLSLSEQNEDNLDTNNSQGLRDAGLPTAFGSTKYRNRNVTKEYKHPTNILLNKKANIVKCKTYKRNMYQQSKSKVSENHLKSSSDNSIYHEGDSYNLPLCLATRSSYYVSPKNEVKQKRSSLVKMPRSPSEMSYNSVETNCQKYTNWYKNLKTHIKQVEMAVYINELTTITRFN